LRLRQLNISTFAYRLEVKMSAGANQDVAAFLLQVPYRFACRAHCLQSANVATMSDDQVKLLVMRRNLKKLAEHKNKDANKLFIALLEDSSGHVKYLNSDKCQHSK